jgi:hypothetical protein
MRFLETKVLVFKRFEVSRNKLFKISKGFKIARILGFKVAGLHGPDGNIADLNPG